MPVLEGWMMGQAGGGAIADILFGKVNPSGKLPETFPLKTEDTPAHLNWPGDAGVVRVGYGLFIGYRYYDAKAMPVLFPFGYGLSYTSFAYSNPTVSASTFKDVDGVRRARHASLILEHPGITLYHLDFENEQAAFVETAADIDLSQAAFYFTAQYEEAERVWIISFETMLQLAHAVALDDSRLVSIYSVGRCGSTLASQIFAQIPGVIIAT